MPTAPITAMTPPQHDLQRHPAQQTYTYDQENRLTGAAGYTYTYDGDGNRVRKSNGNLAGNGTLYWYMTSGVVAESDLAGTLKSEYVFFDGERVARRDGATGAGGVFYYFSDHLKTASVITDSAGVIKAESDYYPWGGELQFVNNDSNDYKFTGKKRDTETGLDYFGARYYSNGLGRFITPDWSATPVPVPYADLTDPQSLNQYSYVRNIPTVKMDVDGHCPDGCVVEGAVVVAAAIIVTGVAIIAMQSPQFQRAAAGALQSMTTSFGKTVVGILPFPHNTPSQSTVPPPSVPANNANTQTPASTSNAGTVSTSTASSTNNTGTIYVVPGTGTKSGRPYVGRHNKPNPAKTRRSNDGRDRSQAKVVDKYPANDTQAGREAEQQQIDKKGGVDKLDNKRNEIAPK